MLLPASAARAAAFDLPMAYLESFGPKGQATTPLLWGLIVLSVIVVLVISGLVLFGIWRRRSFDDRLVGHTLPVSRPSGSLGWIYFGLALTTVILAGFAVWTVDVMAEIDEPHGDPRFTIEVSAEQWWWAARYVDADDPSRSFTTANEFHIPVGEPVRILLQSPDVIHSFWVPALSGKTDVIPGQVNETWIQADKAGVYRGQCTEYCGAQHTNMALRMFADTPQDFDRWWADQAAPAEEPEAGTAAVDGQRLFVQRCGACHTVRGTAAKGETAPDLTHLASRTTIAAGMLSNTPGHLAGWIANPQVLKPGNKMPAVELSADELDAIQRYLSTLD
ncbi:cytochrome c oxidase subunit II [Consotaella aegiceratis]|uniref:cytochrome c oxidase subunit II n=1 Tax=Consotaella aegiceratis TaxID=3097961 RepID=UPI002F42A306